MMGRVGICGAAAAALMVAGIAGSALADPKGVWLSGSGKSHVKIFPCEDDNEKLCGEIVWLRSPLGKDGKPRRDIHNDNKSLRDRPIMGLRVLWDLEDDGRGEWDDGDIYNPEDGETYDAEMEEVDTNTLKVRGCVWFLCRRRLGSGWNNRAAAPGNSSSYPSGAGRSLRSLGFALRARRGRAVRA